MAKDLSSFIADYEKEYPDEVVHIDKEIHSRWEATALVEKLEKLRKFPIVIFDNVRTIDGRRSEFPLIMNVFASRERCARTIGSNFEEYSIDFARKSKVEKRKPIVVKKEDAPVKEVITLGGDVDLFKFPAPRYHGMDPGHYITGGFFTCYDDESKIDNTALHRGWIKEKDEIRVYLSAHTHANLLLQKYESRSEDMKCAFWIGHHPSVCLGAMSKVGFPESHFEAAGGVCGEPLRLVASETLGENFLVPADAEIVIEGIIPHGERRTEGPFGEALGYFGPQQLNPYIKVTAVTHRKKAYFHGVFVGHMDPLVGINSVYIEAQVYEAIKAVVPSVLRVYRPPFALPQIYIQIKKRKEGEATDSLLAALATSEYTKQAFVFDDDVNIFDEREVLWAISTRTQWENDVFLVKNGRASGLDPMASDDNSTTKVGIDCTKPAPPKPFERRLYIPREVKDKIELKEFIPEDKLKRL
jgi:2,5-furandicarboxylate decarboxylase 1